MLAAAGDTLRHRRNRALLAAWRLHGIRTFLPHIRAHGEGGHIVNTASMAGMNSGLGFSPYAASKFAVVNMSEGLAKTVASLGIGHCLRLIIRTTVRTM